MIRPRALPAGYMILVLLAGVSPARTPTIHAPNSHCPSGTVCDRTLGIDLTPPSTWRLLPVAKFPPHTLAFYRPPVVGASYNVRLIVASEGTTSQRNDARAAAHAASALMRGYSRVHMNPPLVRIRVRYGGAPGMMILTLPGQPTLVVVIVLAHQGALYRIVAPGRSLALDQRRALASLRFIPRVGPFPPANPPAPRGHPVTVIRPRTSAGKAGMNSLLDLSFVDRLHGWALGVSCNAGACNRLVLRGTADGGRSWRRLPAPPAQQTAGGIMTSSLFTTRDVGHTWQRLHDPCRSTGFVQRLAALDSNHLWLLCGGEPSAGGQLKWLYASQDGGLHWSLASSTQSGARRLPPGGYVHSFAVSDASHVWLALDRGTLYESADGGQSWRAAAPIEQANPGGGGVGPVVFVDARHGWFATWPHAVYRTDDGGQHWSRAVIP